MELKLQILLIVASIAFTGFIFYLVRREDLDLKYSLTWCFMGLVLVIIALQPRIVSEGAKILGIGLPVNAVFLISIFCILNILLSVTVAVSRASHRTKRLTQEIAILKYELSKLQKDH